MTYTDAVLAQIIETYKNSPSLETVDSLAKSLNIPRRSIISKLSLLGLYQKKVYTAKDGTAPIRKDYYINELSELLDIDTSLLDSLEKATKQTLKLLVDGINSLKAELS